MTAETPEAQAAREIVAKAFQTHTRERCPAPSFIDCAECCACEEGEQLIAAALRAAEARGRVAGIEEGASLVDALAVGASAAVGLFSTDWAPDPRKNHRQRRNEQRAVEMFAARVPRIAAAIRALAATDPARAGEEGSKALPSDARERIAHTLRALYGKTPPQDGESWGADAQAVLDAIREEG